MTFCFGALSGICSCIGLKVILAATPDILPRTAEIGVDPMVLLYTLGIGCNTRWYAKGRHPASAAAFRSPTITYERIKLNVRMHDEGILIF
jgi:hypothetical protein